MVFVFILQIIFLIFNFVNICNLSLYLDFYCVAKSVNRSVTVFSPVEEANPDMNLERTLDSSIKRSIDNLVPCILETIRTELRTTISKIVDAKLSDLRNEFNGKVNLEAAKSQLKTFRI